MALDRIVTDGTETIACYVDILKTNFINSININDEIIVKGGYRNAGLDVETFKKINFDKKDAKRIELNVKTKLSNALSVIDIPEYVKRAHERGYEALGISDLDSVQGFPILEKECSKYGMKPIYGTTVSVYKNDSPIIKNLKKNNIWD